MAFDPFTVSDRLRGAFLRYLAEAHPIHHVEAGLRAQFDEALRAADRFVREPLVSIIPSYVHASTPAELFDRKRWPRLDPLLKQLDSDEFDPQRPLYQHQVKAIERIQSGRNVVVATGTGSGKTECFLLPILDRAVRTGEGVVAVVIYPMNALANDQLGRMRQLVGGTSVTFGRYTSQTPKTPDDLSIVDREEVKRPNELASRQEIRQTPPQILLTNFAMLEYLMLRPKDQDIFRHPTVRYVVLDEAHSYSGAQAIDISLLMRRLQRQYPQKLQFILTSATLGDPSAKARREIADFASRLCGSGFDPADVVFGEVADPFVREDPVRCDRRTVERLGARSDPAPFLDALKNPAATRAWLQDCGLPPADGGTPEEIVFETLRRLDAAHSLYDALRSRPLTVAALAGHTFGADDDASRAAVRTLLTAASVARPRFRHASPLMSVRLHHFFRGLSGASVLLEPMVAGGAGGVAVTKVILEDAQTDPETGRRLLPLSTCVHCGMPAAVIRRSSSRTWEKPTGRGEAGRGAGDLRVLTWFREDALQYAGDEEDPADSSAPAPVPDAYLCLECGGYGDGEPPSCGHEACVPLHAIHDGLDEEGNLATCPCCGGTARPFPSVLRDFHTGEDAPTALLAEELVYQMPDSGDDLPAGGRRLLAFSDSRQRAAYFTPYLSRTSAQYSYIHPLLSAARRIEAEEGRAAHALDVITRAYAEVMEKPWAVFKETDGDGFDRYNIMPTRQMTPQERKVLKSELSITLYQQISSSNSQRTKLPGLLLAAVEIDLTGEEWASARSRAPELFQDEDAGRGAVQRMLVHAVRRYAVQYEPRELTPRHLIGQGPTMATLCRNPVPAKQGTRLRIRWNPYEAPEKSRRQAVGRSRNAAIVRELLGRRIGADAVGDEAVRDVLDGLWAWLTEDHVLRPSEHAGEYQIPASRLQIQCGGSWHRCRRCGTPTIHPMTGTCEEPRCGGPLAPVAPADREAQVAASHRAGRYTRVPLPLVVREHTAQLTLQSGRLYQEEFKAGRVNVLSSSTTFEMGVDVGQLQAVLLRNIPPTAANYIQRAGRAGRRQQGVAHAVSYARSVPHDQHHYFAPRDIVAGRVPVPVIYTANVRLTQRHVNSMLLGRFLRANYDATGEENITIAQFFPDAISPEIDAGAPAARFAGWCEENAAALLGSVREVIPGDCDLDAADAIRQAASNLFGAAESSTETAFHRGLRGPMQSYLAQEADVVAQIQAAMTAKKYPVVAALGRAVQRIEVLRKQLKDQHLIDFLAGQHWLPGYAFPQDVVKLTVRQEQAKGHMRLERDREIGISEYSPGSQVIADGKLFESVGVDLERRQPELMYYRTSPQTRQITIGRTEQEVRSAGPSGPKGSGALGITLPFLEPRGFTTSWDAPVAEPNLFRLRPPSNTQVFLRDGASDFESHPDLPGVRTGIRRNARLFRANLGKKGTGFRICLRCGLGLTGSKPPGGTHTAPWGASCGGWFQNIALAHVFETDVLQVRFPGFPPPPVGQADFWLTLATGMANSACEVLFIDPKDLDSTYRSQTVDDLTAELVLFDRVPGGAGHVNRIREQLPAILRATRKRLELCANPDCGIDSSCYVCLRSQRNQFQWKDLKRSAPLPWLKLIV